jgi:hypothetical protein
MNLQSFILVGLPLALLIATVVIGTFAIRSAHRDVTKPPLDVVSALTADLERRAISTKAAMANFAGIIPTYLGYLSGQRNRAVTDLIQDVLGLISLRASPAEVSELRSKGAKHTRAWWRERLLAASNFHDEARRCVCEVGWPGVLEVIDALVTPPKPHLPSDMTPKPRLALDDRQLAALMEMAANDHVPSAPELAELTTLAEENPFVSLALSETQSFNMDHICDLVWRYGANRKLTQASRKLSGDGAPSERQYVEV